MRTKRSESSRSRGPLAAASRYAWCDEAAATITEYAIILAMIAVSMVAIIAGVSAEIEKVFGNATATMQGDGSIAASGGGSGGGTEVSGGGSAADSGGSGGGTSSSGGGKSGKGKSSKGKSKKGK